MSGEGSLTWGSAVLLGPLVGPVGTRAGVVNPHLGEGRALTSSAGPPHLGFRAYSANYFLKKAPSGRGSFEGVVGKDPPDRTKAPTCRSKGGAGAVHFL